MATTKLWHIKGRLRDLIEYVENPAKTADPSMQDFFNVFSYTQNPDKTNCGEFVTAINCVKEIALEQMILTKKIRWRKEPVKRVVKYGMLAKKRVLNEDYEIYEGRHEPIITQEQWDLAKAAQNRRGHHSTHTSKELQNAFVGILF